MVIILKTISGVELDTIQSIFIPPKGSTILLKSGDYKVIKEDSKSSDKYKTIIVEELL